MSLLKVNIKQIDTTNISDSSIAAKTETNLVQDNVAAAISTAAANDYTTYNTLSSSIDTVQANLTSLVGASPSTLDTLAEIAAALENDANLAVTLTTSIGSVQSNVTTLTSTTAANDYNTYTSLSANINSVQANVDALPDSAANDYTTYTTLSGLIDTVQDNVVTLDNNVWVNANDYSTYSTLSSLIDTVNANVDALPDSAANDYTTYDTLTANIYNTFTYLNANVGSGGDVTNAWVNANDYSTYSTLSSLIDTVQDNLTSSSTDFSAYAEKFAIDGSTNSFILSSSFNSEEAILVSIGGILQHSDAYTLSGNTLTIANTAPLPVSTLSVRSYTSLSTTYASINSDQFTLDGSTNSFTLSSNVSANSDILVSVSGVVQTPSQYVVTNNQLTLSNTSPLPSGVLLEIRHLYAAATSIANATNYTPSTDGDWNGTPPTTLAEAVDRLAAVVKTLNSGTGA